MSWAVDEPLFGNSAPSTPTSVLTFLAEFANALSREPSCPFDWTRKLDSECSVPFQRARVVCAFEAKMCQLGDLEARQR